METLRSKIIAIIATSLSVAVVFVLIVGVTGHLNDPHFQSVLVPGTIVVALYATVVLLPLNTLLVRIGRTRCWHHVLPATALNIAIVIFLGLLQQGGPPFAFLLNAAIWGVGGALVASVFWVLAVWDRSG